MAATPAQIDQLLDKLATDDAFRDQITADPLGTLKSMGISVDPKELPVGTPRLPSKDVIQANQSTIKGKFQTNVTGDYFFLDGKV